MTTVRVLTVHRMSRGTVVSLEIIDGEVESGDVLRDDRGTALEIVSIAFGQPEAGAVGNRGVLARESGTRLVEEGDVLRGD